MREVKFFIVAVMFVFLGGTYQAYGVYDDFDDGVLDSAWQISYTNATGWTYQESGTNLTVSGVTGTATGWNSVFLRQNLVTAGDFKISCAMSWNSVHWEEDYQSFAVQVYSGGQLKIYNGYHDAWVLHRGQKAAKIEGSMYTSGWDTLPYTGSALVEIERKDGLVTASWDGNVLLSSASNVAVDQVGIEFASCQYDSYPFSSFSVDYFSAVPEPGTILLLGLGAAVLVSRRRR
jgi:hypothetical protein